MLGRGSPNSAAGAGGAAYASLLKVVYPAVKAANPNAMLTLSGIAYDFFTYEGAPSIPISWTTCWRQAGATTSMPSTITTTTPGRFGGDR